MRRPPQQPTVVFGTRLPVSDKEALDQALPQQGGKIWLTEVMLTHFLDLCESDPNLVVRVHRWIEDYNLEETPRGLTEYFPKVRRGLYERFNRLFPEHGAVTWFLRNAVNEYVTLMQFRQPPDYDAKLAIHHLLRLTSEPEDL